MAPFDSDLFLTTSQVAELLAVHPSTVKRWCNEGDLDVDKTNGGHRRIHLDHVLGLSRRRTLPTFLNHFSPDEGQVWTAIHQLVSEGSCEQIHALAMEWLTRGQLRRFQWLFHELARHPRVPFAEFCDHALRGFMRDVGEAWRTGRMRVGEEHMASEALLEVLHRLRESETTGVIPDPLSPDPPTAVVGSMEGDRHSLGAHCVRLSLERHGWQVRFLGADVPAEDFAAMQHSSAAHLVCISFAPPHGAADMKRAVRILGASYHPAHPYALALGGTLDDTPYLDDLDLAFEDFDVFDSIGLFEERLERGFGGTRG